MKINLTILLFLAFVIFFSCKNNSNIIKTKEVAEENLNSILKKELHLNLTHSPVYLNPESKPDVVGWKEYIDVQTKVYQLKNITTNKVEKHLTELDLLMTSLYDSKFPYPLENQKFRDELDNLSNNIIEAIDLLKEKNLTILILTDYLNRILEAYKSSKNTIRDIYRIKN